MKFTRDGQLLAVLQHTVSAALKQWLDDNKGELLGVARDAVLESEPAKSPVPNIDPIAATLAA